MGFEIKDLGMTFLAGGFVLLGIEAFVHFTYGKSFSGFFVGKWGLHHASPGVNLSWSVLVALCFLVGLLTEDICIKYDDLGARYLYQGAPFLMDPIWELTDEHSKLTHDALRNTTLIRNLRSESPKDVLLLTELGGELVQRHAFSRFDPNPNRGAKVEGWMTSAMKGLILQKESDRIDIQTSIQQLWMHAHNRIYRAEPGYSEIERIQRRCDFSRTISVVSFFFAILALIVIVLTGIWQGYQSARHRSHDSFNPPFGWLKGGVLCFLMFLLVYVCSTIAFARETFEVNKRVFGYYSTMLAPADTLIVPLASQTPPPHPP
jgi:hypothetical protein